MTVVLPLDRVMAADLLSGLSSVTEGGGYLRSNVGGSSLLSDYVPQEVDENLVVLKQRYRAVPTLESQVSNKWANVDINLTWILSPASL